MKPNDTAETVKKKQQEGVLASTVAQERGTVA